MKTGMRSEIHGRSSRPPILLKAALAGAVAVLMPHLALANEQATQECRFQQALQAYEQSHWGTAFDVLSLLADEGHVPSARMALLIARFGTPLYATRFEAAEGRRQRWLSVATAEGVPLTAPDARLAARAWNCHGG